MMMCGAPRHRGTPSWRSARAPTKPRRRSANGTAPNWSEMPATPEPPKPAEPKGRTTEPLTNRLELEIAESGGFAGGHAFGATGAYRRLVGRVHFAVDPKAEAQAGIVDLDKAPVDA